MSLYRSKEEMQGAAQFLVNRIEEFEEAMTNTGLTLPMTPASSQIEFESAEWGWLYNLMQRQLFVNNKTPHFGILAEIERISNKRYMFSIEPNGVKFRIRKGTVEKVDIITIEVWCLEAAIEGLTLRSPCNKG